ncbi:DinB family protein [Terriglobus roseus]|uniref:DinB superfamily protein n=1 Tax=Terriglobus roseus TaxID=392734 RepID=A0A1G7IJ10_9BACT|nr:DinB family protein [Terriglobus roseus]SDF12514.1 DinB superfamily protein [Terriglobus roseus]
MATVEPWLRGTLSEIEPVRRAVLHALELAEEDVLRWTEGLDDETLEMEPMGLPSVAFQMRHIARSIDRLLTYADGRGLSEEQMVALRSEHVAGASGDDLRRQVIEAIAKVRPFAMRFSQDQLNESRGVGRAGLPTTLAGLLIHIAEHTQRHVGQLITTAKVAAALKDAQGS